jgi:hypothetical protein
MNTCLRPLQDAHLTGVGVSVHVSPSQDIFGGDPIHEQQPGEDFMFI